MIWSYLRNSANYKSQFEKIIPSLELQEFSLISLQLHRQICTRGAYPLGGQQPGDPLLLRRVSHV